MFNTPEVSFLREDEARTERWARLTDGVQDDYKRAVLETMLDNTHALVQGRLAGARVHESAGFNEATTTDHVAAFNRVAYPMIRRIYADDFIGFDLVSVQPTMLPVTMVFFQDFVYGQDQAPTLRGDRLDYQAGKRNKLYAGGHIRGELIGTGDGDNTSFATSMNPVKPGSERVYVDSAETTDYQIDHETGAIALGAAPAAGASVTVDYSLVMEGLGSTGSAQIPSLELRMSSAQVGVESMKLKAVWTIETEQDLQAYHGQSAEKLLTQQLGDEIKRELGRLILDDLHENASAGNVNWSREVPAGVKRQEHIETLLHAIGDISNEIYKKRLVRPNFVVMSPNTQNLLDKLNTFRLLDSQGQSGGSNRGMVASGPAVIGTLQGRYRVIVDPQFSDERILVGYKGDDWNQTGYVYAPYTAFTTRTFIDPNHMVPVKGMMTRFGRHLVSGDFYGTVTITP